MSAAPRVDAASGRLRLRRVAFARLARIREKHVLRLNGDEQKSSDELLPGRRARPEEEESIETVHELAVFLGLVLDRPGSSAESFLRSELTPELEVRIYLMRKKLGDAAPKDPWPVGLLREHAPTHGDVPELIKKVSDALRSRSVVNLIQELREWEQHPYPYVTNVPPESYPLVAHDARWLPKILKRGSQKARRDLLLQIGRAIAEVQSEPLMIEHARRHTLLLAARLVEEKTRETGSKKVAYVAVAKRLGLTSGKALEVMLAREK